MSALKTGYFRTLRWVLEGALSSGRLPILCTLFLGFFGVAFQYLALYFLASSLNEISVDISNKEIFWESVAPGLTAFVLLMLAEAVFTKVFYSRLYSLWSFEANRAVERVILAIRSLPNRSAGAANLVKINNESLQMSGGRPQSLGALIFYLLRSAVDAIKIIVIVIAIAYFDYRYLMIIVLAGAVAVIFLFKGHIKVTKMAANIEALQVTSAVERQQLISDENKKIDTKLTSMYFDNVVGSYFQVRENHALMSFVSTFITALIVLAMLSLEPLGDVKEWGDILMLLMLSRLLLSSVTQFTNGAIMMNRQYTQVSRLKQFLSCFTAENYIDCTSGDSASWTIGEMALVTDKVVDDLDDVLCILYSLHGSGPNISMPEQGSVGVMPPMDDRSRFFSVYTGALRNDLLFNLSLRFSKRLEHLDLSRILRETLTISEFSRLDDKVQILLVLISLAITGRKTILLPSSCFFILQRYELNVVRSILDFNVIVNYTPRQFDFPQCIKEEKIIFPRSSGAYDVGNRGEVNFSNINRLTSCDVDILDI